MVIANILNMRPYLIRMDQIKPLTVDDHFMVHAKYKSRVTHLL